MRPRLVAVDNVKICNTLMISIDASMRPRLVAVDNVDPVVSSVVGYQMLQ